MYSALEERNIYAGENVFYRYGHKAQERIAACLEEHNGYISVPVNGGKYYAIGTSDGKYGEFAKIGETCYSVNRGGYAYAKVGTDKGEALKRALTGMIESMKKTNAERLAARDGEDDDEDEDHNGEESQKETDMTNEKNGNVNDLSFEVVYEDGWLGGHHVVGKYTDIKEADDVAGKTAEMDNAETVLIYVKNSNGEVVGTLTKKKSKSVPHADI